MKRIWCRLKELWMDDYEEYDTMQLSRRDKASLLYGAFMICALTIIAVCIIYNVKVAKVNEQTEQEMYTFLNTVTTYLTAATDDEYMEIAEQIRDDLVLSKFSQNIEEYVRYIPNTANGCCAEQEHHSAQAYLVCTNTGELYPYAFTLEDGERCTFTLSYALTEAPDALISGYSEKSFFIKLTED